jgi:hypothetical protein
MARQLRLDRRAFLTGSAALLLGPRSARSELACTEWDAQGIRYCEVGLSIGAIPTAQQRCQNWCWAACIEAIFALHGYGVAQEAIVQKVFGDLVCLPATGPDIAYAIDGEWVSEDGQYFSASADVLWDSQYFFGQPDAIVQAAHELSNGNPLIIGALGHATVMTAMGYYLAANGAYQIQEIIIRDPWPDSPNRRQLSPDEAMGTQFLAKVHVY